jgi:hypothetical protein
VAPQAPERAAKAEEQTVVRDIEASAAAKAGEGVDDKAKAAEGKAEGAGVRREGQEGASLPPHLHRSQRLEPGHWLLDRWLATARRNHACFVDPARPEHNLGERLMLFGGRFAENVSG